MKARAPGKLVLSGAYAVLEGAPAIVAAVDRYAVADTKRRPSFYPPEVLQALPKAQVPHVDVTALWEDDRKLGLGSSAAVVVSALGAWQWERTPEASLEGVRDAILPLALQAHRRAQGGGSGIDVAASAWGGFVSCHPSTEGLEIQSWLPPETVQWRVYWSRSPSSTPRMLKKVRHWASDDSSPYRRVMNRLDRAARLAASPASSYELLEALAEQVEGLTILGDEARAPIVPRELRPLIEAAWKDGVVVMPSGAGGGDVVLLVGEAEACARHEQAMLRAGMQRLEVNLGARGLHRVRGPEGE